MRMCSFNLFIRSKQSIESKQKEERNKSNLSLGRFGKLRTLYDGMAISTGSETSIQTATYLIVKNNYEQARRKRAQTEKKHAVRMLAGK